MPTYDLSDSFQSKGKWWLPGQDDKAVHIKRCRRKAQDGQKVVWEDC